MVCAGKLRDRITIQNVGVEQNDDGFEAESVSTYCVVWADVRELSGKESSYAQAIDAATSVAIDVRYRHGINPSQRVLFRGEVYDITSVTGDRAKGSMTLFCKRHSQ